jgi:hypothetical protein
MKVNSLKSSASDVNFGVEIVNFDMERDFEELKKLVFEKLVVIIRNQLNFSPESQFKLTQLFDPNSQSYGHGHNKDLMAKSVLQQDLNSIPSCPQVKLLGNGMVADHEGFINITLKHPQHHSFHKDIISPEVCFILINLISLDKFYFHFLNRMKV